MAIKTSHNIEVRTQRPYIVGRGPVKTKEALIKTETWPHDIDDDGNKIFYVYEGMIIPVISSQDIYMLVDRDKILDPDYSGWALVSLGGSQGAEMDGGSANSFYTENQKIYGGNASSTE